MLNKALYKKNRFDCFLSIERLNMLKTAKGSFLKNWRIILVAILLLGPVLNTFAAQQENITAQEKQSQSTRQTGAGQGDKSADKKRKTGKKNARGVFIPSEKVSSDVSVSFPADI